ncbi:hypothetical protein Pse7367_3070 [Thalassoporum mexicanum PCC 7367]|uniref:hypothetical protein n=1 Tax=Thalassoporum mexicanum TaxID=3457544 RepID=UPI00029FF936|nr:hypothetical protein [Pseudanabaena sp. PCC 7367]AFY71319.1 hypothetical protein Pse7367_3070 [Pseudanabaena sp. PCC 7367]
MLEKLKNMFKGSTKAKPSGKNAAPNAEVPAASAKVETAAPKAEKPAAKAKKKENKGGLNPFGLLSNLSGLLSSDGDKKPKEKKANKPQPARSVQQNAGPGEFFLSADDAKTFGDIDYMRTAKAIKKSFPKAPGQSEGAEIEVVVSNLTEEKGETDSKPAETATSASSFGNQPSFTPNTKVKTDTNMDMFRNMAKGIKKR